MNVKRIEIWSTCLQHPWSIACFYSRHRLTWTVIKTMPIESKKVWGKHVYHQKNSATVLHCCLSYFTSSLIYFVCLCLCILLLCQFQSFDGYAVDSGGSWNRGQLLEKAERGWRVFFVDYGEQRDVAESDILRLPDKFCALPAQAIECSLVHVMPMGRSWPVSCWKWVLSLHGEVLASQL